MKIFLRFYFVVLLITFTSTVGFAKSFNLHGFVAQGVIQADNSNFVDDDGDVSLALTEAGVNASYRFNSSLRVAGQGVYLNGGNRYPKGARVDYLFLDWQILNGVDWQVKAQIGRNKNYHWLYSSTRDVPHTRPSIILPQSLYFDSFRDVALGVDGLVLIAQTNNKLGEWDINVSYGQSKISEQEKKNLLGDAVAGTLEHKSDKQFSVYWRPVLSNLQLGIALLDADFRYLSSENDVLFDGDETSQRIMFNLLYQTENWEFASEIMKERVLVDGLLFPAFSNDVTAEGGYFQTRYFIPSSELSLLARLDLYDKDRKDRKGNNIESLTAGNVPSYFGLMDQATVGVTWTLAKNIQLQAEVHRVKGAARLAPIFTPDVVANNSKYWNMWAVQLMYWF